MAYTADGGGVSANNEEILKIGSYVDGKYKILNEISRGGMGVVYMAINEKVNKTWAIKVAKRNGVHDNNTAIQGLAADKKTLMGLSHPILPSIVDVYEDEKSMMIVMDYIEGNPLSKILAESGAQPQELVIKWAKQLCGVLGYLHSNNIIYRDLKPANVMLKPDGNIILIDFGAAREFEEKKLADTQCLGTVGYAAPEQFGGKGQTDARTDIFCLGATIHHLITGIDPCVNTSFVKTPIRQINASLSGGLEKIIEQCLKDDKRERYQSCDELMQALENYEENDDVYKKKELKKLGAFLASTFLGIICFVAAISFNVEAKKQLSSDYGLKIAEAGNVSLSQSERVERYLEAIRINESDPSAYLDIIKLFLSSEGQNGSLTRDETSVITQLKAGVDFQNANGYYTTIYPIESLKARNKIGYEEVCYEIGMAYWYDYEVESERFSSAVDWFHAAEDSYPMAATYVEIGNCRQDIKKYAGQNRTEKMYEAYAQLWEKLKDLKDKTADIDDNDAKLLAFSEIVGTASDKAGYFLETLEKDEMLAFIDEMEADAKSLKTETKYEDIKTVIDGILLNISEAKARINSAKGKEVLKRQGGLE